MLTSRSDENRSIWELREEVERQENASGKRFYTSLRLYSFFKGKLLISFGISHANFCNMLWSMVPLFEKPLTFPMDSSPQLALKFQAPVTWLFCLFCHFRCVSGILNGI